jgi:hypothetical protein
VMLYHKENAGCWTRDEGPIDNDVMSTTTYQQAAEFDQGTS